MSRFNQRTWHKHRVGQVLLTVHLDPPAERRQAVQQHGFADVTRQLIALMDSHRLPVTWAVNDPAHSAATPFILRSAVEHELAILGDTNWLGPTAGRTRFARELARRAAQARAAGIQIKTLVPRVASVKRHIDLVVKQNITAVAGVSTAATAPLPFTPHALHFGVWEFPESGRLPLRARWWMPAKLGVLWQIRRQARAANTFHLVIEAADLLSAGLSATNAADWLMRRVAEMRNRGLVNVETLGAAAARLSAVPTATPQQSILRRAA